jgi:hypothetical protein
MSTVKECKYSLYTGNIFNCTQHKETIHSKTTVTWPLYLQYILCHPRKESTWKKRKENTLHLIHYNLTFTRYKSIFVKTRERERERGRDTKHSYMGKHAPPAIYFSYTNCWIRCQRPSDQSCNIMYCVLNITVKSVVTWGSWPEYEKYAGDLLV